MVTYFPTTWLPWQLKSCDMSTISLLTRMLNVMKIGLTLTKLQSQVTLFWNIITNFTLTHMHIYIYIYICGISLVNVALRYTVCILNTGTFTVPCFCIYFYGVTLGIMWSGASIFMSTVHTKYKPWHYPQRYKIVSLYCWWHNVKQYSVFIVETPTHPRTSWPFHFTYKYLY